MRLDNGGFAPILRAGCVSSVGGGFNKSTSILESIVPLHLLGPRVFEISDGEWTALYDDDASSPACLVITASVVSTASTC
jgi:hypothetical protein